MCLLCLSRFISFPYNTPIASQFLEPFPMKNSPSSTALSLNPMNFSQELFSLNLYGIRVVLSFCPFSLHLLQFSLSFSYYFKYNFQFTPSIHTWLCISPSLQPGYGVGGGRRGTILYSHLLCISPLKQLCHYLWAY